MAPQSDIIAIARTRTWSAACKAVVALGRAAPDDEPAQIHAVYSAIKDHAWAVLLAPAAYSLLTAWQACQRIEDGIEEAIGVRAAVADAVHRIAALDGGEGPDLLSARASAYSRAADTVTRAEAELSRARKELERAARMYRQEREGIPRRPMDLWYALMERSWDDRDLQMCRALLACAPAAPSDPVGLLPDIAAQYTQIRDVAAGRGDLSTALAAQDRLADMQRGTGERAPAAMTEAEIAEELRRAIGAG